LTHEEEKWIIFIRKTVKGNNKGGLKNALWKKEIKKKDEDSQT